MKLLSLLCIFTLIPCANAQSAELPLEHFVQHGDYINIQISPDGKHCAAQVRVDGQVVLVFIRSKDRKALGGVKPGSNDEIHSVTWVNIDDQQEMYTGILGFLEENTR